MNPILNTGVVIGVLCGIWMFVMGLTGWYKDPVLMRGFFLVVVIEVGALIWGLRRTAAMGRNYGGQVVAGTMMAIVGGVIIIGCSLLFTTVAFPNFLDELQGTYRATLQRQGKSAAEIEQTIATEMSGATPMNYAMQGFIGTLVTGILASAVIGIWVRARPAIPPRAV